MSSESLTQTVFTEHKAPCKKDEESLYSETLNGCSVTSPSISDEFPEGGLTAWATAFGVFLVLFCGFGYSTSFGVYQDFYSQHYLTNETSSAISWIGSTNTFLVSAVCIVSGLLHDRGYFYHLVITGSILQSLSLFILSFSKPHQYYQIFLSQGVGSGIAAGLMYIPCMAVISHHFRRKCTLVMTLVTLGSALGAIVHPIMLNYLLNGPVGFANGVRASAALISGLLLIACLCMRTRLDPPMTPVNYIASARKCFCDMPLMFMMAGGFFFQIGFYYPLFFFQLDSIKHGVGVTFSFYALVILNVSSCVGRLTSGFIAGLIGVPNLMVVGTLSCGVVILGMIGLNSLASVVVLCVLYGYFAGVYIAMAGPLVAILTPDLSDLGGRMGICYLIAGSGSLIGAPIAGALLTSEYIWWEPAIFAGMSALAGGMLFGVTRFLYVRRQLGSKASQ